MSPARFKTMLTLHYHGGEAAHGELAYYDAAANILACGDYLGVVVRVLYGESVELRTVVRGLHEGSFSIDFAIQVGGVIATLISGPSSPKDLWDIIRGSFEAWKFLDGAPPQEMKRSGDEVSITNVHGDNHYFRADTLLVIGDEKAGRAVEQFVGKPLTAGLERVEITAPDQGTLAQATPRHAGAFVPVAPAGAVHEAVATLTLEVVSPVFKEGNRWRVSDGQNTFTVSIEDREFLDRVERGIERFGKGDQLLVELRIRQTQWPKLKAERIVTRVLRHFETPTQQGLSLD